MDTGFSVTYWDLDLFSWILEIVGYMKVEFLETGFLETGFSEAGFLETGFLETGFLEAGFLETGFLEMCSEVQELQRSGISGFKDMMPMGLDRLGDGNPTVPEPERFLTFRLSD